MAEIRKMGNKFYQDCEFMELMWDENGKYLSQYQENMLDDEPGRIFISPYPEGAIVANLTPDQMKVQS